MHLQAEANRMFKVSFCCQKFAGTLWRYWFSTDKHLSSTFPGRVPKVFSVNSGGKGALMSMSLELNDKLIYIFNAFILYFLFKREKTTTCWNWQLQKSKLYFRPGISAVKQTSQTAERLIVSYCWIYNPIMTITYSGVRVCWSGVWFKCLGQNSANIQRSAL